MEGHWVFGGVERVTGECFMVEVARISSTKPRPLRQKVITKQGWELSYWGVNAVNQCYDNTPLKRPNTPPLLGVAPNTLT